MKVSLLIVFLLILTACTKKQEPEVALKNFVNYRFKKNQNIDTILKYLDGPVRQSISDLEGEDLSKFLNMSDVKRKKFKILSTKCQNEKCFITYFLAYDQFEDSKKVQKTEVKKIVELRLIEKDWKIFDVSNLKTYIDIDSSKAINVTLP